MQESPDAANENEHYAVSNMAVERGCRVRVK